MNDATDETIAHRVQQGEIDVFSLLMERYEKKIIRYGKKFLSCSDDIRDIAQEIFAKAFVNIRSFDCKRKFSPWLYRIAHNEFVNALKKKKSEKIAFVDFDVFFPHPAAKESADGMWTARICAVGWTGVWINCRQNTASRWCYIILKK